MFQIRRLVPDDWRAYREIRLRALHESPHAFGSTFEVEHVKPDEYWQARLAAGTSSSYQQPLVAVKGADFVGLVWGWIDPERPETAHVMQMWVAPEVRGRGCGAALVDAVVQWAKESRATSVQLRVTCGESPATRLYLRAGFQATGAPEPLRPTSSEFAQPMHLSL